MSKSYTVLELKAMLNFVESEIDLREHKYLFHESKFEIIESLEYMKENISNFCKGSSLPSFLDVSIIPEQQRRKLDIQFSCTFMCYALPGEKTSFRILDTWLSYLTGQEEKGFSQILFTEPNEHLTFGKSHGLGSFLEESTNKLFGKSLYPLQNSTLSSNVALPLIVSTDKLTKKKYLATPVSWIHLKQTENPKVVDALLKGNVGKLLKLLDIIDEDLESKIKNVQNSTPEFVWQMPEIMTSLVSRSLREGVER